MKNKPEDTTPTISDKPPDTGRVGRMIHASEITRRILDNIAKSRGVP